MAKDPKPPSEELDKFLLRMPDGLRDKLKAAAEENKRSMNAEIVARLDFSLIAHPHAYLLRALIDLQEKLLAGKEELFVPPWMQDELQKTADSRGVSAQKLLVRLLLEAMEQLDAETELGAEFAKHVEAQGKTDKD
ncbi:MAG: Arc family DNA-binding protein [Shinella sp.]|jgi:hypothetical protein|nr:Arc family DNA-binding protein [Shinella sp.]